MAITTRTGRLDDFAAAIRVVGTAFLEHPDAERMGAWLAGRWDPDRLRLALDGELVCGTLRTWGTELTVPGGATLPAAAVTAVAVLPTHRRRGILRRLAEEEHAAMRERGEPLAVLLASEWPIYGRFGYGPATRSATLAIETVRAQVVAPPASGSVELVVGSSEIARAMAAVHDAARRRRAGEIRRNPAAWPLRAGLEEDPWDGRWSGCIALRRDARGAPDGYVRYRGIPRWEDGRSRGVLEVDELCGASDDAEAELWRHLLERDLVVTVRAPGRPLDDQLPWLLGDPRAARCTEVGDQLWVRLLDPALALEARAYDRVASLVLELRDPLPGAGATRLLLDAGPDGARCRPTRRAADLVLPVVALGAAYLGGTRLRDVVRRTGADEATPGALDRADALLRAAAEPWCGTQF